MTRIRTIFAIGLALMGVMALGGCKLSNHRSYEQIVEKYLDRNGLVTFGGQDNADKYIMGGASLDAQEVSGLEIDWLSDSVSLQAYDGNDVVFSEVSGKALCDSTTMHYHIDSDGTLEIAFGKPGVKMEGKNVPNKRLTVKVPRTLLLEKVELNGIGYNARMDSIRCETLEANYVSNRLTLNECQTEEIEVNGVSTFVEATFSKMPEEIELNNVSGNTVLYVPEDAGITWEQNGIKNDFSTTLPVHRKGMKRIIGDGSCKIECNSINGSLEIKAKGAN